MKKSVNYIFVFLSIVILLDFIVPYKKNTEQVLTVKSQFQQYYNAARNSHFSYEVITPSRSFLVSTTAAKKMKKGEEVIYKSSMIFNKVNSYSLDGGDSFKTYSLRYASGLIVPFLVLIVVGLTLKNPEKLEIVSFVFKVALIADLVWLIFF